MVKRDALAVGMAIINVCEKRFKTPMDLFDHADYGKSNAIDKDEFNAALKDLAIHVEASDDLFEFMDVDKNMEISRDEFKDFFDQIGLTHRYDSLMTPSRKAEIERKRQQSEHIANALSGVVEETTRYVALLAYNEMKQYLIKFVEQNVRFFKKVQIVATHSTSAVLQKKLGIAAAVKVASGPFGGEQQIGAMIAEGKIAAAIFFKDPLYAHPHAADIEAFCRLCDVRQIPYATNPSTAQAIILALATWGLEGWYHDADTDGSSSMAKYKRSHQDGSTPQPTKSSISTIDDGI